MSIIVDKYSENERKITQRLPQKKISLKINNNLIFSIERQQVYRNGKYIA